ncbi:MAG: twitching motility protein PilT [Ignavibacteria bacterium]|nr:twitching motility protein PilT [Ignavibacteria bacterium]
MLQAYVRCYAELNDHLPAERKMVTFAHSVDGRIRINEMLKAIRVPSSEVDLVLVNRESVDLSHVLNDGDKVSLYPVFESFDITTLVRVRSRPLRHIRFVLDVHLGKLASHLRMLGFDTLYWSDYTDDMLVSISKNDGRTLLSRDQNLINDGTVTRGYCVHAADPRLQLIEVLHRFDLFNSVEPFKRCMRCNSPLQPVGKEIIVHRLPPKVRECFDEFQLCQSCERIYWKGSHYSRMQAFIEGVLRYEVEP